MKVSSQIIATLKELLDLIGADDVQEIEIERGFFGRSRIRVVRASEQAPIVQSVAAPPVSVAASTPVESPPKEQDDDADDADDADAQYYTLKSPMVGMFYQSPNPDAPPYVQEGDEVGNGQTMCIIEAMKIMNEIECDVPGHVVRVLVDNASPVEYNTPLFLLDPQQ